MDFRLIFVYLAALFLNVTHTKSIDEPQTTSGELRELIEINGKNYYFFMQDSFHEFIDHYICTNTTGFQVSWYRAVEMCAGKNMTLASLETKEEDDALNRWLLLNPAYDQFLWTSGARLDGTTWRWEATGQDFSYLGWQIGEPNIAPGTPTCMNFLARPIRGWTDDDCNIALHPFCEEPDQNN